MASASMRRASTALGLVVLALVAGLAVAALHWFRSTHARLESRASDICRLELAVNHEHGAALAETRLALRRVGTFSHGDHAPGSLETQPWAALEVVEEQRTRDPCLVGQGRSLETARANSDFAGAVEAIERLLEEEPASSTVRLSSVEDRGHAELVLRALRLSCLGDRSAAERTLRASWGLLLRRLQDREPRSLLASTRLLDTHLAVMRQLGNLDSPLPEQLGQVDLAELGTHWLEAELLDAWQIRRHLPRPYVQRTLPSWSRPVVALTGEGWAADVALTTWVETGVASLGGPGLQYGSQLERLAALGAVAHQLNGHWVSKAGRPTLKTRPEMLVARLRDLDGQRRLTQAVLLLDASRDVCVGRLPTGTAFGSLQVAARVSGGGLAQVEVREVPSRPAAWPVEGHLRFSSEWASFEWQLRECLPQAESAGQAN